MHTGTSDCGGGSGGFCVGGPSGGGFRIVGEVTVVCEGHGIETRVCCSLMILDIHEQLRNAEDVMIQGRWLPPRCLEVLSIARVGS